MRAFLLVICLAALGLASWAWTWRTPEPAGLESRRAALDEAPSAAERLSRGFEELVPRRRAAAVWERWNRHLAGKLAARPPVPLPVLARTPPSPEEAAVSPLDPPAALTAETRVEGFRVAVRLSWIPVPPVGFLAPRPRFEVWRWREPGGRPERLAAQVEGSSFQDLGLPGGHRLVYAVYAVTEDGRFSRSSGSTVRVELPSIFAVELDEPPFTTEESPPPAEAESALGPPPEKPPEEIALRVRRLDGRGSEDVVVRVGDRVGSNLPTGLKVERLEWVRTLRPVRFLEPVFADDGSVVLEDGEPKMRARTHNLETHRAACVLVDPWGTTTRISPPSAPNGIGAGMANEER